MKPENDKRKAFKELKNHIEKRLPLCPRTWRHESHKIGFLRDALVSEDWAANSLSRIGASPSWWVLCTELGNALQIHIEREGDSREILVPAISSTSNPNIFFAAPRYAKKVSKAMYPGSEYDDSCWNCGKNGHRHAKCLKPINFKVIAAKKAAFLENKQKSGDSSQRVLHEMVEGLQELMDLADSDEEDSTATAFFQDSSENIKTDFSSEADVKDVGHALATLMLVTTSIFRSGCHRPKYSEHQAYGSSSIYLHTYRRICSWHLELDLCRKDVK